MIRNHLRSNAIAYLALFFALSGTAMALPGSNTVFSDDITNGEVKTPDLANAGVTGPKLSNNAVNSPKILDQGVKSIDIGNDQVLSADVRDDTFASGGLAAVDLQANSVGSAEIQTDAVQATEIANDSIDSGEIVDFGLSNQDVGVLFAEVSATGALDNSSGGVSVIKLGGSGNYEVDFARNITACSAVATIGPSGGGSALGEVNVADRGGNVEAVFVDTNTSAGAGADLPFRLVVVC
ncbi:MAG: hypothetical protein GEU88_14640 [Solirubrobacterales bacterium]|nr:hypothetical protein [Solirubrobacterales bacterium]